MDQSLRWKRARPDLAHAPDFALGPAQIRPSRREIALRGTATTIEPRVMQILVALAEAGGATLSRDDLIDCCWDGLAVTDDAVTQSIAKLRKTLGMIPGVAIETVPRVGYRLTDQGRPDLGLAAPGPLAGVTRRRALAGAAAASALALGSWALLRGRPGETPDAARTALPTTPQSREASRLHAAAVRLFREPSRAGYAQAERLLRRGLAIDPANAPCWARLAIVHYAPGWFLITSEPQARERARAEAIGYARRALTIDPNLAEAHAAMGFVLWEYEPTPWFERAARLDPDDAEIQYELSSIYKDRMELRRALVAGQRALDLDPTYVRAVRNLIVLFHDLGRSGDAYRLIDRLEKESNRPADARRCRFELAWEEGRLAASAALSAHALMLDDPDNWWAKARLLLVADRLGDRATIDRLIGLDRRLRGVISPYSDTAEAVRLAHDAPDEWWVGLAPGARARLLLDVGEGKTLLGLYDARCADVGAFWTNNRITAHRLAPPLILALRAAGRTAEATQMRARFAAATRKLLSEGQVSYLPFFMASELAALDGRGEDAGVWLDRPTAAGWRGQNRALDPDRDLLFGPVRGNPTFTKAAARLGTAIDLEAAEYRRLKLDRIDWAHHVAANL